MSDCKNCDELRRQNEALQSKVIELKAFIESVESEVQSERNRNEALLAEFRSSPPQGTP